MQFRASVDNKTYTFTLEGDQLYVEGKPVSYSLEEIFPGYYSLLIEGTSITAVLQSLSDGVYRVTIQNQVFEVFVQDERQLLLESLGVMQGAEAGIKELRAPMPGLVLAVHVTPGEQVDAQDALLVLEAMKMENELRAPADAVVQEVYVRPGEAVVKDQLLLTFE